MGAFKSHQSFTLSSDGVVPSLWTKLEGVPGDRNPRIHPLANHYVEEDKLGGHNLPVILLEDLQSLYGKATGSPLSIFGECR